MYCNLQKVPLRIHSDSDTISIIFEKEQDAVKTSTHRLSAREGFKAIYRTFQKTMSRLVDSHRTTANGNFLHDLSRARGQYHTLQKLYLL